MEIVRDLDQQPPATAGHALTIGFYDGVHLGHKAVIRATQDAAAARGIKTGVITFDPHPATVLRPESAPSLITDLEQKLDLLAACGVDTTVVVPFDVARAQETAEQFVARIVVRRMNASAVVVGSDFHFGKDRTGNVDLLTKLGEEHGFDVEGIQLLSQTNTTTETVSSTAIRLALVSGEVTAAARMLGRNHEIRGPVTEGDKRGRTIGFPTANVAVGKNMAIPGDAVYAAWYVRPDGEKWPAAVNIGKRPTFYQNAEHSLLEAHLIGFSGDLYGEAARVQLVAKLRPEQKFSGIDELQAQLQRDIATASGVLAAASE